MNKKQNRDVPYDTIIKVLLLKIKSLEEENKKIKEEKLEDRVNKVIKEFKKSLNLTQLQILQCKTNPYYIAQVKENIGLRNKIKNLEILLSKTNKL